MTQTAELPRQAERRAVPEHVRRLSRYKFAMARVQMIAGGTPRLADEELEALAAVLLAARTTGKKKKAA